VVGRQGRVTGRIGPGLVGEVVLAVRGGSEAFYAYAAEPGATIGVGELVLVVEYDAPRTVIVTSLSR
jgi:hypothetical protein